MMDGLTSHKNGRPHKCFRSVSQYHIHRYHCESYSLIRLDPSCLLIWIFSFSAHHSAIRPITLTLSNCEPSNGAILSIHTTLLADWGGSSLHVQPGIPSCTDPWSNQVAQIIHHPLHFSGHEYTIKLSVYMIGVWHTIIANKYILNRNEFVW